MTSTKNRSSELKPSALDSGKIESNSTVEPGHVFRGLETRSYSYASLCDPLLATNTSKVDPLPHQIVAVYGYVLKLPRIRFMLQTIPAQERPSWLDWSPRS